VSAADAGGAEFWYDHRRSLYTKHDAVRHSPRQTNDLISARTNEILTIVLEKVISAEIRRRSWRSRFCSSVSKKMLALSDARVAMYAREMGEMPALLPLPFELFRFRSSMVLNRRGNDRHLYRCSVLRDVRWTSLGSPRICAIFIQVGTGTVGMLLALPTRSATT
jgi:hypothetical protein